MSENKTKPNYEVLPLNPENDPPETIEEIEILIDKLQNKALSIKQQIEVVNMREKQGLDVDYLRLRRTMYAKAQTNKSIAALQKIVKLKKQQLFLKTGNPFERFFFEAAKETLSTDIIVSLMATTFSKMQEAEKL
jgi:hypothetical protein